MIKYFLFISLLVSLGSCHRKLIIPSDYVKDLAPVEQGLVNLIAVERDSLKSYNTMVDVYGKYFSGVTYFKNIQDSSLRVLFTTHTGMKLLDMELANNTCNTKYVVEQMDNVMVLKLLCHDFKLLTGGIDSVIHADEIRLRVQGDRMAMVKADKDVYYYLSNTNAVSKIVETVPGKMIVQTEFVKDKIDSSLLIVQHYNFKFKLTFKKLILE